MVSGGVKIGTKRVYVANIPLHAYACAWVEVPEDTTEEGMQEAIAASLLDKGYVGATEIESSDLDEGVIAGGWEFIVSKIGGES